MARSYDVVVIGAGTGGCVAAIRAAQLGQSVAVVEKQKAPGGTCLIWGCIPTKALLEHAHALKVVQNAKEWGVDIPEGAPAINMAQVHARKDKIIIGSGAVGVEFASIFRRFGSEVTIIELLPRLAPVEDEAISAELEKSFRTQGITCLTGTTVTKATAGANGVALEARRSDGQSQTLTAEILLVATGRGPVTAGLGAEALGMAMDRGYIKVLSVRGPGARQNGRRNRGVRENRGRPQVR